MRRYSMLALFVVATLVADKGSAQTDGALYAHATVLAAALVPCCTPDELKTIADLNYIARVALKHQGPISARLYAMNMALTRGNWRNIPDPDLGQLLGYMTATDAGKYWHALKDDSGRSIFDRLALAIRVTIKPATLPATVIPADSAGVIEAAERAAMREEITVLQAQLAGLMARVTAVEQTGGGSRSVGFSGITQVDTIGGNLTLRSNIHRDATQSGITDSYCAMVGVNGWDGGYRVLQNWNHCGTKHLPYGTIGMDSMGDFSYNWFPAETNLRGAFPDNAPASVHENPAHPLYAPYRGQALVISGGGQTATGYLTGRNLYQGRNVMIAAQRAGQSIYFAVSPHRSEVGTPLNRALMWLEANPSFPTNPVHIVIDGELRRLKACNVGGQRVVCF